jgi:hypothetical protein
MKFDLQLLGKNEFYPKLNNKTYNIYVAKDKDKIQFMINSYNNFINNKSKKKYLGMDFEFNKVSRTARDVALCQINLEDDSDIGNIYIFDPKELDDKQNKVWINLLCQPDIVKIIHGGESLDIPFLFDQLLIKKDLIDKFIVNLFS